MMEKKNNNSLRVIAIILGVIGAVGSLYFMFNAGRHQKFVILLTLFNGWVLSPYAGFFFADKISTGWNIAARSKCWWLLIIISITALVCYSGVLLPPGTKLTFLFLIVPLISLLLLIITFVVIRKEGVKELP
jgi:hypothetical protein